MYAKVVLLDTSQNFTHKEKWDYENPWHLVKEKLSESDIPHVDFHKELFEAFSTKRESVIHPVENLHYSPHGNMLVSHLLSQNLKTE